MREKQKLIIAGGSTKKQPNKHEQRNKKYSKVTAK